MQIVIDIPTDTYERITRPDRLFTDDDINKVCWAVYNGTVLPKEHGRLIDADDFFDEFSEIAVEPYINAQTVLEADNETKVK